jgi:glyoxylase-like metal-dependent hydrolase (beta-lactamase superfamily II)
MIQVKSFVFNPIQVNTYVLYADNKDCYIIDPGCYFKSEYEKLYEFIESNELNPIGVIITHFHFDHLMGCADVVKRYNITVSGHVDYKLLFEQLDLKKQAKYFDFDFDMPPLPAIELHDGDLIKLGDHELQIFHIPGHSPCGIALYSKEGKFVIVGDILFDGSIGRTDLFMGNLDLLLNGIKTKLFVLDDEVRVLSGHGYETSIGKEKLTNPFM